MTVFYIISFTAALIFSTYIWFSTGKAFDFWGRDLSSSKRIVFRSLVFGFCLLMCAFPRSLGFVIVVQLFLWYLFFDAIHLIVFIIRKIAGKDLSIKVLHVCYHSCLVPVGLVFVLTLYGIFNMTQIHRTEYTVASPFIQQPHKVLFISDLHYDTIQNPELLERHIQNFNDENLDLVIFGGDLCDESTSFLSMQNMFDTLGKINSKYGSYLVYGNHDRQLYSSDSKYSVADYEKSAAENGITILKDKASVITDDLVLFGREDVSAEFFYKAARKPITDFIPEEAICTKFLLVADHQPKQASLQECLNYRCGLQLSGHTHAGQIFPFGQLMKLFGAYVYGKYTQVDESSKIDVIVSSGFTGWGFPMRTEQQCEYVIINLIPEEV